MSSGNRKGQANDSHCREGETQRELRSEKKKRRRIAQQQQKRNQRAKLKGSLPQAVKSETVLTAVNNFRKHVKSIHLVICQSCGVWKESQGIIKMAHYEVETLSNLDLEDDIQGNPPFEALEHGSRRYCLHRDDGENTGVNLCNECHRNIMLNRVHKMPVTSLMRGGYHGRIPDALRGLTFLEEVCIALYHPRGYIFRAFGGTGQIFKTRGNFVILPNASEVQSTSQRKSLSEISDLVTVVVDKGWQRCQLWESLRVRRQKIFDALVFLKTHCPAYRSVKTIVDDLPIEDIPDVILDKSVLEAEVDEEGIPASIDHVGELSGHGHGGYLVSSPTEDPSDISDPTLASWILNLRSGDRLVPDFYESDLWCKAFPTLFPFGIPVFSQLSQNERFVWLVSQLQRDDGLPGRHFSFAFYLRDLRNRYFTMKKSRAVINTSSDTDELLSERNIKRIVQRLKNPEIGSYTMEEKRLLRRVAIITACVVGSRGWKIVSRIKLQALNFRWGRPTWWVTLNFNLKDSSFKSYSGQEDTSNGPAVAMYTKFLWNAFLAFLAPLIGGVSHFFSQVESQGSGGLHIHALLWSRDCSQWDRDSPAFGEKLLKFVESVVSECFDDGIETDLLEKLEAGVTRLKDCPPNEVEEIKKAFLSDGPDFFESSTNLRKFANYVALLCQVHRHSFTCYKVKMKGKSGLRKSTECRFNFPKPHNPETSFQPLKLRRNHSWINNWCWGMTAALRCNTDIKPVMENGENKSMVYYLCNYTVKSDNSKNAYKSISDAYQAQIRAGEWKQSGFLNRAANRLIRMEEISSPLACFHLIYNTDYFSSDTFRPLNLISLENWVKEESEPMEKAFDIVEDAMLVTTLPWVDYKYRPEALEPLSLFKFLMSYSKGKINDQRLPFMEGHPQSGSHGLFKVTDRTLYFQGRSFPSPSHEQHSFFRDLLFLPWRCPGVDVHSDPPALSFLDRKFYNNICEFLIETPTGYQTLSAASLEGEYEEPVENVMIGYEEELPPEISQRISQILDLSKFRFQSALRSVPSSSLEDCQNSETTNRPPQPSPFSTESMKLWDELMQKAEVEPLDQASSRYGSVSEENVRAIRSRSVIKHDLDGRQAMALSVFEDHIVGRRSGPMKLLIVGPGGSGKTRTIQALKDMAQSLNMHVITGAYWGSAAANIGSATLHQILGLHINDKKRKSAIARHLRTLELLIIDEVSVLGLKALANIDERLSEYTDHKTIPGLLGIHVAFVGDFLQHNPVADIPLWTPLKKSWSPSFIMGYNIWQHVSAVVVLEKNWRVQCNKLDFILRTLRQPNDQDLQRVSELLNERVQPAPSDAIWIVHENVQRWATLSVLRQRYFPGSYKLASHDTINGTTPTQEEMEFLSYIPEHDMGNLRHEIFLYPGMNAVLVANINPEMKMANGTPFQIKEVFDDVIIGEGNCETKFPGLPIGTFPIFKRTFSGTILVSGQRISVSRKQFPIWEGCVLTSHKSQGRRISPMVTDLRSAGSFAAQYVPLSRAPLLDDVYITRKISIHDLKKHSMPQALQRFLAQLEERKER